MSTDGDSAQSGEKREDEERNGHLYVFQNKNVRDRSRDFFAILVVFNLY